MSSLSLSSSSSSFSSSSSSSNYDVFLSFRGEDTRLNFTDHLYAALQRNGIVTFKDDPKLEAGKEIAPELFKAIQQSCCSVIIFSETYPFSSWCLEELAEIVKQKKERGHKIFPIFYGVDPSDLRKQKEKVEEAFAKHEERYKEDKDKIERWRNALTEVANIKGWHSINRHESEFIGDIVKKISAKLCQTYIGVPNKLIAFDSRLKVLRSKIDIGEDDVRIIGICGMGGIGKTTLARVVYTQMSSHFEYKCFLADVREASEKYGLVSIQKQLLSQIFSDGGFNFFNVHDGNAIICSRLSQKKVLLVIDDVDEEQHLKCLASSHDWFGSGSIIIITTRDEHLLRFYEVYDVYKPKELNDNEALRLFNLYAFGSAVVPEKNFMGLSKHVVTYAGGLPLALEVLGSFLRGRGVAEWKSAIERLKRNSHKKIHDKLKISFDGLEESEKETFLDIACFFNGEKKDFVRKILDSCGFFPDIGIGVLIEKSLVKVDEYEYLCMHHLLQEMGRKIVREKFVNEPGKHCRLWEAKDVYHVLTEDTATEAVEGMVINIRRESNKTLTLSADAFLKMKKLRLLRVLCRVNCQDLNYLSNALRLLGWREYPLRSLPSSFQPDNLVALLLSDSHIEQPWEGNIRLDNLKEINLEGSKKLIKTPDLTMAPKLEILILEGCTKIVDVHPSIGVHRRLKRLDLSRCSSLRNLPTKIGMESLEELICSDCSNLESFPAIGGKMERLRVLYLDRTGIEELPSSLGHLSGLKSLTLIDCKSLRSLPTKFGMESLEYLILSGCSNLQKFPEIDGNMECLLKLVLDGTSIKELPSSVGQHSGLKHLNLRHCKSLTSLTRKIGMESLEVLMLSGCSNLESFAEIDGKMECLRLLCLDGTGIEELPSSIGNLSSLARLYLQDCSNLVSLPSTIDGCKSSKTLNLSRCYKVENLPDNLQQAEFLEELHLSGTALIKPPSFIYQFKNLKVLSSNGRKGSSSKLCPNLKVIPRGWMDFLALPLPQLSGLRSLYLRDCNLCEGDIPRDICCLSSLKRLDLGGNNFINLSATLTRLSNLEYLGLSNCGELKSLPELLTSIAGVAIDGCTSLEVVANPSKVCNSVERAYISGSHCYRLAENINALTLLKKHLKGFANSRAIFDIALPGSEMPEWFRHQRGGGSIKIPLPLNILNDSQWIGVVLCCVFVINSEDSTDGHVFCGAAIRGKNSRKVGCGSFGPFGKGISESSRCPFYNNFNLPMVKDHLFLRYFSRNRLYPDYLWDRCGEHETENLSTADCSDKECDELELHVTAGEGPIPGKVKKCGVRIVYEKDLEEVEQIKEQHSSQSSAEFEDNREHSADVESIGNGSLKKRKRNILEEEEEGAGPQPKRMQKILNFIMGRLGKKMNTGKSWS